MEYYNKTYDVAVIGAGHAGIEAALASSRLGCETAIFCINMDSVGNCPCNPSIGGTAKGHLVRELDALGGEMGKTADEALIQIRMLNRGKGPSVHSLRAQIDRTKYSDIMKNKLEKQQNLELRQAEIINIEKEKKYWALTSRTNIKYLAKTVVLATGTYLSSKIYIGELEYESGPDGMFSSVYLSEPLIKLGLKFRKFKTGTPARILKSSIKLDALQQQKGDEETQYFSYDNNRFAENKTICYIGYTNEKTRQVIIDNIGRSPMFDGKIKAQGPRYCPSIEDKIIRFADKKIHQFFLEPCGLETQEMYLQGLSTSLPEDVQIKMYRTIKGLENCVIMRPAYAIEYDCVDPTQMNATLEFKELKGLYGAGQINGSSGYEEAAVQGFVAGVNAALSTKNKKEIILKRTNSYIGTLIDDIVTKGVTDPYRMMTSRSEHRLFLRQDNADERLTPIGRKIGLIDDDRWHKFTAKQEAIKSEIKRIKKTRLKNTEELKRLLVSRGTNEIKNESVSIAELLKRPQISYEDLKEIDREAPKNQFDILEKVEVEIKYEGYIEKQLKQIDKIKQLENKTIPQDINYEKIKGIRLEAREKLNKIKPANVGQASRVPGVTPADISVILVWLKQNKGA